MSVPELHAPGFLMAMPQVLDPFFARSLILLLHHDDEGSFGFVINRPTDTTVAGILAGMSIAWGGEQGSLAYLGGPVRTQLGTVLFDTVSSDLQTPSEESAVVEVVAGIAMTQHINDLNRLAEQPPRSFRLLLGYSGWGAGQLMQEVMRNDWLTGPVLPELIWSEDPSTVWDQALESIDVDPQSLPAWTANDQEQTN